MDTINGVLNISIVLIVTYMICYAIVYAVKVYDLAVKGRGSVLDNPFLAKIVFLMSTLLYYMTYGLYSFLEGSRIFILQNVSIPNAILILLILLALIICILYMKVY